MPAFLALAPLLAIRPLGIAERIGMALAWLTTAAFGAFLLAVAWAPDRLAGTVVYQHNFSGWRDAAALVRANVPASVSAPTPLLADDFMLAAELQFELGDGYRVFAADHPNNLKHGRQSVLATIGRDEAAFDAESADGARWFVADQSATPLRARAQRAAAWCAARPGLQRVDERYVDHGEKRLFLLRWNDSPGDCDLPVFGYLDARPGPEGQLQGFMLSPSGSTITVRARAGELILPLQHGITVDGLERQLPPGSDPALPNVGIHGRLPATVPDSTRVTLEFDDAGTWRPVVATRISRR